MKGSTNEMYMMLFVPLTGKAIFNSQCQIKAYLCMLCLSAIHMHELTAANFNVIMQTFYTIEFTELQLHVVWSAMTNNLQLAVIETAYTHAQAAEISYCSIV